jgi:hypothetical protein
MPKDRGDDGVGGQPIVVVFRLMDDTTRVQVEVGVSANAFDPIDSGFYTLVHCRLVVSRPRADILFWCECNSLSTRRLFASGSA